MQSSHHMDEEAPEPIAVQVVGQRGFVWSIPDVLRLRKQYRLIGRMVGGVSGFKSQVAVGGLPLQLEPEEVALALEHGWVRLYEAELHIPTAKETAAVPGADASAPGRTANAGCGAADEDDECDEYYAAYYGLAAEQQGQQQQQQRQQGQLQQLQQWTPPWAAAVSSGARYELPLTVEQLAASLPPGAPAPPALARLAAFSFPSSPAQAVRLAVFRDLHARGYCLTGGAKFGGAWLAYPGDPALFHSQYVVRLAAHARGMCPVALRCAARGVHTARKHLVLASIVPASDGGRGCAVRYLTVAKADGFGGASGSRAAGALAVAAS